MSAKKSAKKSAKSEKSLLDPFKKPAKKAAKKKATKKVTKEPVTPEKPAIPTGAGSAVVAFEEPDLKKGILDEKTGAPVEVVKLNGKAIAAPAQDTLLFAKCGRSYEWLTPAEATNKFAQDPSGQIFYDQHGFMGVQTETRKPIDLCAIVA